MRRLHRVVMVAGVVMGVKAETAHSVGRVAMVVRAVVAPEEASDFSLRSLSLMQQP